MFRRIVSLLLLPGLLLSQAAVVGHAHGDHTPAGHSARPHVHTFAAPADHHHAHGHHHGPGGHHHHHDDEDDEEDAPTPTAAPTNVDPPSDHDADAVFVSTETVTVERLVAVDVVDAGAVWVVCGVREVIGEPFTGLVCPARNGRPPPDPSRPLYVRHLALLM